MSESRPGDLPHSRCGASIAAGVAEEIATTAAANGIPIDADPELLRRLGPLRDGIEIPSEAYRAVAEILTFLYAQNSEPEMRSP